MVGRRRILACAFLATGAWQLPRGLSRGFALPLEARRQGRVALVTGANKGIGKEVARKLVDAGVRTILGCRDVELGEAAAHELGGSGGSVACTRLDLTDSASVEAARDFILREFGCLDVLVNNAAVCFNDPTLYGRCEFTPFEKQARITVDTNFFGTLEVIRAMLPLLRQSQSPRIVNVASYAGRLGILRSQDKLEAFTSSALRVDRLEELMEQFVRDAEGGVHAGKGWPNTCYGISKLGLIALTRILAREEEQIMSNSADPGYCATDQNNCQGFWTAERGARTPAMLALLADSEFVSGEHFHDEAQISWSYS